MRSLMIVVAIAGLVPAAGCLGTEDDIIQFEEAFESCGLCDWTVTGTASVVTTNHPAEHAAELEAGTKLTTPLGIVRDTSDDGWGNFTDGNWIEYSTDCHARPDLRLVAVGLGEVRVEVGLGPPGSVDFERRRLMLPPLPPTTAGDEPSQIELTDLVISSRDRCRIDNIRVMVSGGTIGY